MFNKKGELSITVILSLILALIFLFVMIFGFYEILWEKAVSAINYFKNMLRF